jgi:serine/threonine protein kinase
MAEISLNQLLKQQQTLHTNIGTFTYIKSLGEGGNSYVFLFAKEDKNFAIKFLKPNDDNKLKRFKDEFFCAMQISTHKNVAQAFHFDCISVNSENYFIIIMKSYEGTLNGIGNIEQDSQESKSVKGWKLFTELASALQHLHDNKIIHRDVKPHNIFFDNSINEYVLGDLGIAHFSAEDFPKESKTKPAERLANFSFSPPEQFNSKSPAREANDIYALGQVLQWFLAGSIVRGLGRSRISTNQSPKKLIWLDSIIDISLRNDPDTRFQSISDIYSYVESLKAPPPKNLWKVLHNFDDVIRKTFPKINKVLQIKDKVQIKKFLSNFHEQCKPDDFWYMTVDGGDNTYQLTTPIGNDCWLFGNEVEFHISELIIHRDNNALYRNFFVFLISPSKPFEIIDSDGKSVARVISEEWLTDTAVFWNGSYIDPDETKNGYYEINGESIPVDRGLFLDRMRHLQKFAYIVVPEGTPTAYMMDREPTQRLLASIIESSEITTFALEKYLKETRGNLHPEITKYM